MLQLDVDDALKKINYAYRTASLGNGTEMSDALLAYAKERNNYWSDYYVKMSLAEMAQEAYTELLEGFGCIRKE